MGLVLAAALVLSTATLAGAQDMKIAVGIDQQLTSLRFDNPNFSTSIGALFESASGTNSIGFGGNFRYKVSKGTVLTNLGAGLVYADAGALGSAFIVRALFGGETIIAEKLNVGFDVYPFSFASATVGGTTGTSFALGGGQVYAYLNF